MDEDEDENENDYDSIDCYEEPEPNPLSYWRYLEHTTSSNCKNYKNALADLCKYRENQLL